MRHNKDKIESILPHTSPILFPKEIVICEDQCTSVTSGDVFIPYADNFTNFSDLSRLLGIEFLAQSGAFGRMIKEDVKPLFTEISNAQFSDEIDLFTESIAADFHEISSNETRVGTVLGFVDNNNGNNILNAVICCNFVDERLFNRMTGRSERHIQCEKTNGLQNYLYRSDRKIHKMFVNEKHLALKGHFGIFPGVFLVYYALQAARSQFRINEEYALSEIVGFEFFEIVTPPVELDFYANYDHLGTTILLNCEIIAKGYRVASGEIKLIKAT